MSSEHFNKFKNQCSSDISSLQDEFMQLYNILSYEHWYYDHGIGVFHFQSNDGRNLYFKYVDVGSYSTKTNTWMWSWHNESTPKSVTKGLEKVKAYGNKNDFSDLTTGYFDGDEYTGWELTSVTAKLLNGLGVYRVPSNHLFIYFTFTNEISQDEFDALKENQINCDIHGQARAAFVCQHLIGGVTQHGFHESFDSDPLTESEDDLEAWCNLCEQIRLKEGEWNEVSMDFAKIKLVCDQCYFDIKQKNQ